MSGKFGIAALALLALVSGCVSYEYNGKSGDGKGSISPMLHDAILALAALGFSDEVANKMVGQVVAAHPEAQDTESIIRLALKS